MSLITDDPGVDATLVTPLVDDRGCRLLDAVPVGDPAGTRHLCDGCRVELRDAVAGLTNMRVQPRLWRLLTDRERDVAVEAASGATNREIARRLGTAVRTVENHLSRVYAKLGIARRAELQLLLALTDEPRGGSRQ